MNFLFNLLNIIKKILLFIIVNIEALVTNVFSSRIFSTLYFYFLKYKKNFFNILVRNYTIAYFSTIIISYLISLILLKIYDFNVYCGEKESCEKEMAHPPIHPYNGFDYAPIDVLKYNKLFVVDENNKTTWVGSPNWESERERILNEHKINQKRILNEYKIKLNEYKINQEKFIPNEDIPQYHNLKLPDFDTSEYFNLKQNSWTSGTIFSKQYVNSIKAINGSDIFDFLNSDEFKVNYCLENFIYKIEIGLNAKKIQNDQLIRIYVDQNILNDKNFKVYIDNYELNKFILGKLTLKINLTNDEYQKKVLTHVATNIIVKTLIKTNPEIDKPELYNHIFSNFETISNS